MNTLASTNTATIAGRIRIRPDNFSSLVTFNVADGQGVAFWMPKVAATNAVVQDAIASLREAAKAPDAKSALDEAKASLEEFSNIDRRAREYLKTGQRLMAGRGWSLREFSDRLLSFGPLPQAWIEKRGPE